MTRNQKMAIEILKMLDSGICAEVGYMDNAEAQRRFDVIKSTIEEMKADVD